MEHSNKKKWLLLAVILSIVIAIPTLLSQYFLYLDYQQKKAWPIIEARVIDAKIVGKRAILPLITYQYQVNGQLFTGKTDLQAPPFGLRNKRDITARAIIKEHPIGSKLLIAYNPQKPEESTAGLHLPWNFYMKISFAFTLLILSGFLLKRTFQN